MQRLLLLLSLLVLGVGTQAQDLRKIKGTVQDMAGKPVPMLTVALEGTARGTLTSDNGSFELINLQPGKYKLRVGGVGYTTLHREVDLSQSDANLSLTIAAQQQNLQEVIVSASRTVEALDETPASVHVLDSRTLQLQTQVNTNISDILAQTVPGLALSTNTTSNTGQTLRGRNVLVMVDGIPQSTPLRAGSRDIRTIDPQAIERVEVVKGATAVYGNGADGGLINYITKKADTDSPISATTYVAGTGMLANSDNTFGGRITQQFTGKVNNLDYVVNGSYEQTGVYKDGDGEVISPVYGLGETKMYNAFGKLGYNINEKHRIEGMYNYFSSRQNSDYVEQVGVYGETPTIGVRGERQGKQEGTRYNHNAQLRYTGQGLFLNTSLDASLYLQDFYTIYGYTSYFENGGQSTILSQKKGLRLNFDTPLKLQNTHVNFIYGLDYLNDVTSQPLVDGRTWVPEMDLKNLAPYAQVQVNFAEDFIFKTGLRYDNVNIDVPDFTQLRDAAGNGGNSVQGGNLSFSATTFNAGLRYARLKHFKPFVSYTQGFSMIDVGRYVRGAKENFIEQMDLEPVIVNNYEVGFHSTVGKLNFSGAYFISTSELGANLVADPTNTFYVIQRAPERIEGFEAVADLFLHKVVTIGASAAYAEGKVDLNDNEEYDDEADSYLNGTRITPLKLTGYVNLKPTEKINLNLQWLYSGNRDQFDPLANGTYAYGEGPVDAFHLVNLSGTYSITEKINLNLGIENLLNETYYLPAAGWYGRASNYTRANGARFQLGATIKWN